MALIPKPKFPNVPNLPGVPQLARSPTFAAAPAAVIGLGVALGALWQSVFATPQWGIFRSQNTNTVGADGLQEVTITGQRVPIAQPDSFGEFDYSNGWSVTDAPSQDGGFQSYNKVGQPFEIVLRVMVGGSVSRRREFLRAIDDIAGDTKLYDILTPEKTYTSVNITKIENSRRGSAGYGFFAEFDIYFREIRFVTASYSNASVAISNPKNASAVSTINNGVVQAVPFLGALGL